MKPYVHIAIRTKIETVGWDIGGQLLESLYLNGGLLVPEFVSEFWGKTTVPFEGASQAEKIWAEKAVMRSNGSYSEFFLDFVWRRKKAVKSSGYVRKGDGFEWHLLKR